MSHLISKSFAFDKRSPRCNSKTADPIVRVLTFLKVDNEPLVFRPFLVLLQVVLEGFVANEEREPSVRRRVYLLLQHAFNVRRPAFIQPEVRRVSMS